MTCPESILNPVAEANPTSNKTPHCPFSFMVADRVIYLPNKIYTVLKGPDLSLSCSLSLSLSLNSCTSSFKVNANFACGLQLLTIAPYMSGFYSNVHQCSPSHSFFSLSVTCVILLSVFHKPSSSWIPAAASQIVLGTYKLSYIASSQLFSAQH